MTPFYIRQGDLLPLLRGTITDPATGAPMDLTGWAVALHLRDEEGTVVLNRAAAVDPDNRHFVFTWQAGDTATPGTYEAEIEASKSGKTLTVPTRENQLVEIVPAVVP